MVAVICSTLRQVLRDLWGEILTPSAETETTHKATVVGISHVMLGAAFAPLGYAVAALYWFLKERKDLRRKGALIDGLIDTAFVTLGAVTYAGDWRWPVLVLAGSACLSIIHEVHKRLERNSIT